jgi:hypothetical protein
MTDTEGTVTGAGTPRATDREGAGERNERDLFPGQEA